MSHIIGHVHSSDSILTRVFQDEIDALTTHIVDDQGFHASCTPMGELRVAQAVGLVGPSSTGNIIDENSWIVSVSHSGIAYQAHNEIVVGTEAMPNCSGILESVQIARYIPGVATRFRSITQLDDVGVEGNRRRWGLFNATDGAFFELEGTALSACTMKGGVRRQHHILPVQLTTAQTYEIYCTNAKVTFVIDGVLYKTILSEDTWSDTLNLPLRIESVNTTNETVRTVRTRAISAQALGSVNNTTLWKNIKTAGTGVVLKRTTGRLHMVVNNNNAGEITLYDGVVPSVEETICNIDLNKVVGNLVYNLDFQHGLCYTSTGDCDITITYE